MESQGVQSLSKNTDEEFQVASQVLIRIATNILKFNNVEKYRSVKIDSKVFQEKILPIDGAIQCLLEMGFQEDGDRFTLVVGSNLNDLTAILDQLVKAKVNKVPIAAINKQTQLSQSGILQRIISHFDHSLIYDNTSLQRKAKLLIPLDTITAKANKRLSRDKKADKLHCLLLELLAWFKRDFFTWTDKPKCTKCESVSLVENVGAHHPTDEELAWGASRVEAYRCSGCSSSLRFPRYNHPEKLLQTRTGRCGEWANCFTLICRALDFEARHVMDWTDHVWTEVFIPTFDRWLHCDPCENACDRPLVYEQGWKKKLSLVVAVNSEQVVDVTWRYSVDRSAVNQRRDAMFDAAWLAKRIAELNETKCLVSSAARKKELVRRSVIEQTEFDSEKTTNEELGGRTSGSLAWRLARGETSGGPDTPAPKEPLEIRPTDRELEQGQLSVTYFSSTDGYCRKYSGDETVDGWESLIYTSNSIVHKEEMDWKKSYLSRTPGSVRGCATWKIRLPATHRFSAAKVRVSCATFDSGSVSFLATSDVKSQVLKPNEPNDTTEICRGSSLLSVHAFLRGGTGDCGWQKAQLFRESTDGSSNQPSLLIHVKFDKR